MKRLRHVSIRTVGRTFGLGVVVATATGTLWLVGMPWLRALALAVPIGAGFALARTLGTSTANNLAWPPPPQPLPSCAGWHHVALVGATLHESTSDADRFRSVVAPRLRRLAEARLREHDVHWDDPAARELLGPRVYDLLAWPPDAPPSMAAIAEALSRIEALGGSNAAVGALR